MNEIMNTLFGPLDKDFCLYFLLSFYFRFYIFDYFLLNYGSSCGNKET